MNEKLRKYKELALRKPFRSTRFYAEKLGVDISTLNKEMRHCVADSTEFRYNTAFRYALNAEITHLVGESIHPYPVLLMELYHDVMEYARKNDLPPKKAADYFQVDWQLFNHCLAIAFPEKHNAMHTYQEERRRIQRSEAERERYWQRRALAIEQCKNKMQNPVKLLQLARHTPITPAKAEIKRLADFWQNKVGFTYAAQISWAEPHLKRRHISDAAGIRDPYGSAMQCAQQAVDKLADYLKALPAGFHSIGSRFTFKETSSDVSTYYIRHAQTGDIRYFVNARSAATYFLNL